MNFPALSLVRAPYGLSFAIEDLVTIREWSDARGLVMNVLLDQTMEEAEFEELLILSPPDRSRRTLTIWRTVSSFYLQMPDAAPRAFPVLEEALDSLRPARPKRAALLRFFRLAS